MVNEITYSKRTRNSGGMLVIPIPKEISDDIGIGEGELLQVTIKRITQKEGGGAESKD